jgi:hypothetical protein
MKKLQLAGSLLVAILAILLLPGQADAAESLKDRVRGHILLQVEQHGEAYYVDPADDSVVYMPDGQAAYGIMRERGLGITDADLDRIPSVDNVHEMGDSPIVCEANELADRVKGRIVLQVEQHGEAWYIDPVHCQRIYMKDGAQAYEIMRYLGLGISDTDLEPLVAESSLPEFYEILSNCDYEEDGVQENIVCQVDDEMFSSFSLSRNKVTKEANLFIGLSIPDSEEYTVDNEAAAPMFVNLVCEMMAAVFIEPNVLLDKMVTFFDAVGIPLTESEKAELRQEFETEFAQNEFYAFIDGYDLRLQIIFDDAENHELIAECVTRGGEYEDIEFIAHRDYPVEGSLLGIQIGAPESPFDMILAMIIESLAADQSNWINPDPELEKNISITQKQLNSLEDFISF